MICVASTSTRTGQRSRHVVGKIVPALYQPTRKVLLVGQAPGADEDLRPLTGTMGRRLAELAGYKDVSDDETIGRWFSRANVLDFYPGRAPGDKGHNWPIGHARVTAANMWPRLLDYQRILFCGRAVFDAFRSCSYGDVNTRRKAWLHQEPLTWYTQFPDPDGHREFAWMPHTSMIVPWWNDETNVLRAAAFLTDLRRWVEIGGAACAA